MADKDASDLPADLAINASPSAGVAFGLGSDRAQAIPTMVTARAQAKNCLRKWLFL